MLVLPFDIEHRTYAISINNVKEIIPIVEFLQINESPVYICGLINYRGVICPVVDSSILISGRKSEYFLSTRIIIIETDSGKNLFGLLAEHITETMLIPDANIIPVKTGLTKATYINSTAIVNDTIIQLLDPDKIYFDKIEYVNSTIPDNNIL